MSEIDALIDDSIKCFEDGHVTDGHLNLRKLAGKFAEALGQDGKQPFLDLRKHILITAGCDNDGNKKVN